MTPAQLTLLAEQAEFAAGFFAATNPAAARRLSDAATVASELAAQMERRHQVALIRSELADIRQRLERRSQSRSVRTVTEVGSEPRSTISVPQPVHDI
jgi:hypothetical protein